MDIVAPQSSGSEFSVGFWVRDGGSGRNVGLVNAGMWVMPSALPGELGEDFGNRLLTQLGNAPSLVFELIERHGMEDFNLTTQDDMLASLGCHMWQGYLFGRPGPARARTAAARK